jgi:hypothetical protein
MTSNSTIFKGIVRGKTIELEREPGLPDGQQVTVTIETPQAQQPFPPGEGIRRSAGAWADDPEGLDEFLTWNRQQRKASRPEIGQ